MDKNYFNDNYNLVYSDTIDNITNYILRNSVRYFVFILTTNGFIIVFDKQLGRVPQSKQEEE